MVKQCIKCDKGIYANSKGLLCSGACGGVFHTRCVGVSDVQFEEIKNGRFLWRCQLCPSDNESFVVLDEGDDTGTEDNNAEKDNFGNEVVNSSSASGKEYIEAENNVAVLRSFDPVNCTLDTIALYLKNLAPLIIDIQASQSFIASQFDEGLKIQKKLVEENANLKNEIQLTKKKYKDLEHKVNYLESVIDKDQQSKNKNNNNIVVSGLPDNPGGAFEGVVDDTVSPFGYKKGEGIDAGYGEVDWICNRDREQTDVIFATLNPIDGKISGAAAKSELIKSKLPNSVLSKIWKLSDVDADGFLDEQEFALAKHLINVKLDGNELPNVLPEHLIPPSKRC